MEYQTLQPWHTLGMSGAWTAHFRRVERSQLGPFYGSTRSPGLIGSRRRKDDNRNLPNLLRFARPKQVSRYKHRAQLFAESRLTGCFRLRLLGELA